MTKNFIVLSKSAWQRCTPWYVTSHYLNLTLASLTITRIDFCTRPGFYQSKNNSKPVSLTKGKSSTSMLFEQLRSCTFHPARHEFALCSWIVHEVGTKDNHDKAFTMCYSSPNSAPASFHSTAEHGIGNLASSTSFPFRVLGSDLIYKLAINIWKQWPKINLLSSR